MTTDFRMPMHFLPVTNNDSLFSYNRALAMDSSRKYWLTGNRILISKEFSIKLINWHVCIINGYDNHL